MSHAVAHAAQATRYLYSANRLKYPLVRRRLIELWRRAGAAQRPGTRRCHSKRSAKAQSYRQARGKGGFIRSNWKELNQLIAAANVWTIKIMARTAWPVSRLFRRCRWSLTLPVPAISLLGGTCLSFYDWYCDLPPASPMTGRADRRAGVRRLVQLQLYHRRALTFPRRAPRRPFLYRGSL